MSEHALQPIAQIPQDLLCGVKYFLFDIDDTFTTHGKVLSGAFKSLEQLQKRGIQTIAVTGRPAGWCDHIARMWPVDAVIGENGAFYQRLVQSRLMKVYSQEESQRRHHVELLMKLKKMLEKEFSDLVWASDQNYREFDLAVDTSEDVIPWTAEKIKRLTDFCLASGATFKISSIHVNIWYGAYDKLSCVETFFSDVLKINRFTSSSVREQAIYVGDSPNDEPFFKAFPLSVGVANCLHYKTYFKYLPKYITEGESSQGFQELVDLILTSPLKD